MWRCTENVALAEGGGSDPKALAQFNLNQGLANLADAVSRDLASLRQEIQTLQGQVAGLRR